MRAPQALAQRIPFSRPSIGEEEVAAVADVLRSGWLTSGPKVQALERAFAGAVAREEAIAVSSCTAALFMCLQALELPRGCRVLVPALTWPSAVSAALVLGLEPVLADVESETLSVSPRTLAAACDARTRAVIPVHFAGLPYDVAGISAFARERALAYIDDCAHALGAARDGVPAGRGALAACYSFHPIKNMTTGEGGMITTDDAAFAQRLRRLRLLGVTRDAWARYGTGQSAMYDVAALALKHNLTDVQAAIGLAQLGKLAAFNARRRALADRYLEALADVDGLILPARGGPGQVHAWHLFIVRTAEAQGRYGREAVVEALAREGIQTGLHFVSIPDLTWFRRTLGLDPARTPNAVRAGRTVISLPLYPGLTEEEQDAVIAVLRGCFR
jgi:dTDP-4-amino-4,6-dideoxygalactose transaminase